MSASLLAGYAVTMCSLIQIFELAERRRPLGCKRAALRARSRVLFGKEVWATDAAEAHDRFIAENGTRGDGAVWQPC